ncbi:hypothetical protein AB0D10_03230 [Kitasatospora sp. NPDC048545]|uniref:hypothetical protein n=1 Tax=Kitasatospora sp. NPDC048545 TaxID=3157208 RepID=UPI00340436E9
MSERSEPGAGGCAQADATVEACAGFSADAPAGPTGAFTWATGGSSRSTGASSQPTGGSTGPVEGPAERREARA